ncbi:MAG: glycosyltransferase [Blastocatellia bacterium]|nr:glycosyltransferase [Blastocatellia bacterium]
MFTRPMHIDVIIATHNRAALLGRAIESLLRAPAAARLDFTITVVDNACGDETAQLVHRLAAAATGRVRYLREPRLGKSLAVNRGIAATAGEIIALVDDDQVMAEDWLEAVHGAIAEGFDYVTGPVAGDWEAPSPRWYDGRLHGVLSLFDGGGERLPLEPDGFREIFSAGNAAIARSAIDRVGGLHPALGKISGAFTMCEDGELLLRLRRAGMRGVYEPRMAVRHRVPGERLTRRYFRRWHLGYGRSMALVDALHPRPVAYWFGLPRYLIRTAIEAIPRMAIAAARGDRPGSFLYELQLWFILGFLCGRLRLFVKSHVH